MNKPEGGVRITKRTVDAARPEQERVTLWDTELKGFGLRVAPTGVKTYIVRYRVGGGRTGVSRQLTLGRHGVITADQAREEAVKALAAVTLGRDPQSLKAEKRQELTVADLCDLYEEQGCATKRPSTRYSDRGRIEHHIKPLLGPVAVSAVSRGDIERFLRDVAEGKTAKVDVSAARKRGKAVVRGGRGTASRTVGLLGGIFEFAVARELRADNPVRGVKRFRDRTCERFLSPAELGALGAALSEAEASGANCKALSVIRLLALTGARKSEITALRWSEVDFDGRCLRLAESKTGPKVIPLGAPALAILADVERHPESPFVFRADGAPQRPFQGVEKVWLKARMRAGLPDVRMHDLRHSFASIALAGGSSLPLIGRLLGHADVKTTSRYAHLSDSPLKAAADTIASSISGAMAGASGDVVLLKPSGAR